MKFNKTKSYHFTYFSLCKCLSSFFSCYYDKWEIVQVWLSKTDGLKLKRKCNAVMCCAPGSPLSVPPHCDFENGLCGFTQEKKRDVADWVLIRGPTSYTGLKADHTTGVGLFLFFLTDQMNKHDYNWCVCVCVHCAVKTPLCFSHISISVIFQVIICTLRPPWCCQVIVPASCPAPSVVLEQLSACSSSTTCMVL